MRVNGEAFGAVPERWSGWVAWLKSGCAKAKAELQRLKPLGFGAVYVVAKATTHKDSRVTTRAVTHRPFGSALEIQMPGDCDMRALRKATTNQMQRSPGSVNLNW